MNRDHTIKHLEHYTEPHRLTPWCKCGRKADIGRNVDHPNGLFGEWICRKRETPEIAP